MNQEFINRLREAFNDESMADVARRLKIPHATVRNYFKDARLPAPEVLIKIANETGVSLNWLLIGTGDKYAGQLGPIGLGRFIEEKIGQMIEQKLASGAGVPVQDLGTADRGEIFDVAAAIVRLDDPQAVMGEWFRHEGRSEPKDYGVVFFRGWETFSPGDKIAAIRDAKRVLDRSLAG